MDVDQHLGLRLRMRRRKLGLTQKELAVACGIRFQQIQKYECGDNRMSASRLYQLAGVLGVGIDYFFQGLPGVKPASEHAEGGGDGASGRNGG